MGMPNVTLRIQTYSSLKQCVHTYLVSLKMLILYLQCCKAQYKLIHCCLLHFIFCAALHRCTENVLTIDLKLDRAVDRRLQLFRPHNFGRQVIRCTKHLRPLIQKQRTTFCQPREPCSQSQYDKIGVDLLLSRTWGIRKVYVFYSIRSRCSLPLEPIKSYVIFEKMNVVG